MTVKVTIPDDLYNQALLLAEKRGLATEGNGKGVPVLLRMALKAYLSKYGDTRERPTMALYTKSGAKYGGT